MIFKLIVLSLSLTDFRNEIRKKLESCGIVEDGNDASKLYKKQLFKLNDELIAADPEEDSSVMDKVRAKLNDLFINAQTEHDVIATSLATTLTKKIDALIANQKEHVAYALKKAVTELYLDARKKVAALYVGAEKESGKHLFKHTNKISPYDTHTYFPPPLSLSLSLSLKSQCAGLEEEFGIL